MAGPADVTSERCLAPVLHSVVAKASIDRVEAVRGHLAAISCSSDAITNILGAVERSSGIGRAEGGGTVDDGDVSRRSRMAEQRACSRQAEDAGADDEHLASGERVRR